MQVGTSLFYEATSRRMIALDTRAGKLQEQISTGKRLTAPSDDPLAYRQLSRLDVDDGDAAAFGASLKIAQSTLAQADTSLTAITAQITRARELTTQAANGIYGAADRASMADQIDAIIADLTTLANVRDTRGQPIFGGDTTDAVVKNADGTFTLATTVPPAIPMGSGEAVTPGMAAAQLLAGKAGGPDILTALTSFAQALRSDPTDRQDTDDALDALAASIDTVSGAQGSLGARAARLDLVQSQMTATSADRSDLRKGLEEVDMTQAITDLQRTMTVLQATQASFAKLSQLSLFDYLR